MSKRSLIVLKVAAHDIRTMIGSISNLQAEIDAMFAASERAWKVHLCCHIFGSALDGVDGLPVIPAHWEYHRSTFCMAVKRASNQACIAHDLSDVPRQLATGVAGRMIRCPAGIFELVQPVHFRGHVEALLYLGQFKGRGPDGVSLTAQRHADLQSGAIMLAAWLVQVMERLSQGRILGSDDRLGVITTYLDAHLAEDPDLGALAAHLGISAERARHVVSELSGCSFTAYKDQRRLRTAQTLLMHGFKPVSEVARMCGCADPGWFARWFRRQTGEAPGAFRRRSQDAVPNKTA